MRTHAEIKFDQRWKNLAKQTCNDITESSTPSKVEQHESNDTDDYVDEYDEDDDDSEEKEDESTVDTSITGDTVVLKGSMNGIKGVLDDVLGRKNDIFL